MKARIIREPRCALLWRIDESYPNYAAIARAARRKFPHIFETYF